MPVENTVDSPSFNAEENRTSFTIVRVFTVTNGGMSYWSDWTTCSRTCGTGITLRSRDCSDPRPFGGGIICSGITTEQEACSTGDCAKGIGMVAICSIFDYKFITVKQPFNIPTCRCSAN